MLDRHRNGRISVKRYSSGHHLIHYDTKGINVTLAIHKAVSRLLRGCVMNRSHHIGTDRVGCCGSCDTKVCDFYFSLCGDNDVLRLDIPVDNAFVMGSLNTSSHLDRNADSLLECELSFFLNISF